MSTVDTEILTVADNVIGISPASGTTMTIPSPVTTDMLLTTIPASVVEVGNSLSHDSELERQGEARVTRLAVHAHGRQEDGTPHPLTSTTMANVIITNIPHYQPNGTLAIPADYWAQFRGFITQLGGDLEFEETRKRGFIFGEEGLWVYQLTITLPDDADVETTLRMIDATLKAAIRGHLTPAPAVEPV